MGPWARPPLTDLSPHRIALLKPSALGDIVHSLPVLAALRRRFPAAHLTWIVNSGYRSLLEGHPDLDAILPFDRGAVRGGLRKALSSYAGFFKELRRQRFDLVIDLQGLLRTGIMALASGASRHVGLASAAKAQRWFYTDLVRVPDHAGTHAVDRYWRVAEALGITSAPLPFHVPLPSLARSWAGSAWPAGRGRGSWWGPARAGRPSAGRRRISRAWRAWRKSTTAARLSWSAAVMKDFSLSR